VSRAGVRVTGGGFRGRLLAVPPGVRPSEGRLREALFSIWGERLAGCRFLDLFAGSGAVAAEAASRGAAAVVAVEADAAAARTLAANFDRLGAAATVQARRGRLPEELARLAAAGGEPFDLVFADPPYGFARWAALLAAAAPLLAADGELVVEHAARDPLPRAVAGLVLVEDRRYGGSALGFYRRSDPAASPPCFQT
jgi:16S rRNA (guanine(966)-N(2))-methyltransferase RsmD